MKGKTRYNIQSGNITLSPIYDVTAMRIFEGDFIVPLTRWSTEHRSLERAEHWLVGDFSIEKRRVTDSLKELREAMRNMESMLREAGTPAVILEKSAEDQTMILESLAAI